jgi:SAM-dependent methyltransferase
MLDRDNSAAYKAALDGPFASGIKEFSGHWFQRIDYPQHFITSTSNPDWAHYDEGGLNTLGNRLTNREASLLRPWPKWLGYIKGLMPNLRGKNVLEIGSSNGFFAFRMAELGAACVTGVEAVPTQCRSARWSADVLGYTNIQFLNTDFLMDNSIAQHDVVFLSEVANHFLFPFAGLAKIINLARELVILDTGAIDTLEQRLELDTAWSVHNGALTFHSFTLSDGLLMQYLELLGVPANRITRFKAPAAEFHILYLIDTRYLLEDRKKMQYPIYVEDSLQIGLDPNPGTYPT